MKKTYIHYGQNYFDEDNFRKISNRGRKPLGGLWASPMNTDKNWFNWCQEQDFHLEQLNSFFNCSLSDQANVLQISTLDDLKILSTEIFKWNETPKEITREFLGEKPNVKYHFNVIDFEKLAEKYDGIEISVSNEPLLEHIFMGWDCDTLLIFHSDIMMCTS